MQFKGHLTTELTQLRFPQSFCTSCSLLLCHFCYKKLGPITVELSQQREDVPRKGGPLPLAMVPLFLLPELPATHQAHVDRPLKASEKGSRQGP